MPETFAIGARKAVTGLEDAVEAKVDHWPASRGSADAAPCPEP